MITINDFLELFLDENCLNVVIYGNEEGVILWQGNALQLDYGIAFYEVASVDNPRAEDCIAINVDDLTMSDVRHMVKIDKVSIERVPFMNKEVS